MSMFDRRDWAKLVASTLAGVSVLQADAADDRVSIAVCTLEGEIVGCVFFKPDGAGTYMYRLAVSPEHQGKGIAKRLIAHVVEWASTEQRSFVSLNVRIVLEGNRRLFASQGFQEVSRHRHDGFDHDTYIRMEKPLKPTK